MITILISLLAVSIVIIIANLQEQQAASTAETAPLQMQTANTQTTKRDFSTGSSPDNEETAFQVPLQLAWYSIALLNFFIGLNVLAATFTDAIPDTPQVALVPGVSFALLCAGVGSVSLLLIRSRTARVSLRDRILRPLSDPKHVVRLYQPDNSVHTTAVLLALFQIVNTVGVFVLGGGLEGLAEQIATNQPALQDLLLNVLLYVGIALLGVGLFIRRDWQQTLDRLALRLPRRDDVRAGVLWGLGLFGVQIAVSMVWTLLADPETLQQQTAAAEQIFQAFSGSLLAGFVLALTASVGEEILFRGALQPVFGLWATSVFFVLLHTQYALTPASVIILLVALGFGWVRKQHSTTAAIIAHFIYNFLPFIFVWLGSLAPETTSILMSII